MMARRLLAQAREIRDLRRAYESLLNTYHATNRALAVEKRRAADMALRLTEPCESCEVLEQERDDARLEVDEVRAALMWLERDMKLG